MSRVAKNPITLPKGVTVNLDGHTLSVKGAKGEMVRELHPAVGVAVNEGVITVQSDRDNKTIDALAGTTRANINNMVVGVSTGYEKKLTLVGVGYRAAAKGDTLSLALGFSHPVEFQAPAGITLETPSQTEIIVKGCDRQVVGQVAANIRSYRPPEPYKGKGIRYSDEVIIRKEAKKK
ncbi:50S ribosomal protein L6 [Candidatus Methylospira mobilis]|uniref:Large ribosomal subunit protein uL6 n=1 Tax=Candidatus Methylospira mobilis TaxID=1808979 RepID=A0A5Q0BNG8_9GAMM|nr:50S ribosomal protein L6 [Candidatus Methylospira mobilis]QFY43647.1 50S ribosomal protein L6 [Candidatus Methylospira mobilis]WNV04635.1 50S ribosomal protein L6 [Candidatus Methylospira mobilis]